MQPGQCIMKERPASGTRGCDKAPPPLRRASLRYGLGCKENLEHPANDLFDVRRDGRPHENDGESGLLKSFDPVKKASRQAIECRHGGSEHDQPVCVARTAFDAALGRELHEGDSGSKEEGRPDPVAVGSVGLGTLPDPTP
jgi:hypothetical protein